MVEEGDEGWGWEGGPAHVGSVSRSLCQPQLPDLNAARITSSRRANEPPRQCTTLAAGEFAKQRFDTISNFCLAIRRGPRICK